MPTSREATSDKSAVDRVLVDTNVLLAATDTSRRAHEAAVRLLNEDPRAVAVTPQIVREYLAVATRPTDVNGLGLRSVVAVANSEELLKGLDVIAEDVHTAGRLAGLVRDGLAIGKQVHDANIVAVALTCGARAIVTDNRQHFARFQQLIDIESLAL